MSETKIAQSIIDDVSVVLANTVFHSDLQGETYDALRSKAAELLGKLDVTASELRSWIRLSRWRSGLRLIRRRLRRVWVIRRSILL